jgi:hypothetical protein
MKFLKMLSIVQLYFEKRALTKGKDANASRPAIFLTICSFCIQRLRVFVNKHNCLEASENRLLNSGTYKLFKQFGGTFLRQYKAQSSSQNEIVP